MRSRGEIELEIKLLAAIAKDIDTEFQSNDTRIAAGAHDALRWALSLSNEPLSDNFLDAK